MARIKQLGNGRSPSASVPAIDTHALTKFYGAARGVEDLDLRVEDGEIFGFLGPNGAGKTTTIRLLMGLIRPTRGSAFIFGKDVLHEGVATHELVGYLPGELSLWPTLTGWQTLVYLGNLRGGLPRDRMEELAARISLDLNMKTREYSTGNKQKLGLVAAFMHNPRLLILDEPTAGLDPLNQQEFFNMVAEARQRGATVFMSSHILSVVEHICDRVGIIRQGALVRVGDVADVIAERNFRVTLTLDLPAEALPAAAFAALPGVSAVASEGSSLSFVVHGPLDPVLKLAAHYPVLGFTSHEPTLEEAFLEYYLPNGHAPTAGPAPAPEAEREAANVR